VPKLNIIVAAGLYTYDSVPFFFVGRGPALNAVLNTEVPDPMVDMFVQDITEGITGTGVRAGMLKYAIEDQGMTPGVERVMRAVATAHHRTGAPVTVHTHPGSRSGLEVKRVLCEEEGVDPRRIVLGHSGDTTDRSRELRECLAAFMEECVYPAEAVYARGRATSLDPHHVPPVVEDLQVEARSPGLWNLFLPGVSGLGNVEYAPVRGAASRWYPG